MIDRNYTEECAGAAIGAVLLGAVFVAGILVGYLAAILMR